MATAKVLSQEPSSITTNSQSWKVWAWIERIAAPTVVPQLNTGMPMVTRGLLICKLSTSLLVAARLMRKTDPAYWVILSS